MKLSFDKSATRKIELWATSQGLDLDDLEGIAKLVIWYVEEELAKLRPKPEEATK